MLVIVGEDDITGYNNNKGWIAAHPDTAFIFDQPKEVGLQLSPECNGDFKDWVTGHLLEEGSLMETF